MVWPADRPLCWLTRGCCGADLGEEQRTVVARNVEFLLSIGPRLLEVRVLQTVYLCYCQHRRLPAVSWQIVCNDVSDSDARLRPLAGVLINTLLSLSLQMHKFTVTWLERELIRKWALLEAVDVWVCS